MVAERSSEIRTGCVRATSSIALTTLTVACSPQRATITEAPPTHGEHTKQARRSAPPPVQAVMPAEQVAATGPLPECPADMVHVKRSFCTKVERHCVEKEQDAPNRIEICHEFEEGRQQCVGDRVDLDFCIDRYEYPNKKGERPLWMVDWYDAMGLCAARDRRLCYESEWVAACEGPDEKPFPYGWKRSADHCNIDNRWIAPDLKKVYSENPEVAAAELARLDQSVPSGSKPSCVSGYGVFDLTGNVDEWTMADRDRPKKRAVFAALKGGAWGHVRNACRPVTTSHEPEFRYYFVSFRCCKDPSSMKPFKP